VVSQKSGNKFGVAGTEPLIFKGELMVLAGFAPQGTCADALLENEGVLSKKVPQLRLIIEQCQIACGSITSNPATQQLVCHHHNKNLATELTTITTMQIATHKLTQEEVFSIVLYTHMTWNTVDKRVRTSSCN